MKLVRGMVLALIAVAWLGGLAKAEVVFLDFVSATDPNNERVYTSADQDAIISIMNGHYAAFGHTFSSTAPTSGVFSTITFNDGDPGGLAQGIDFRNLNKGDTAVVNINGLIPTNSSSADWRMASANIASHEYGHLLGLRHHDSYGPIGSGVAPSLASSYLPVYPGPATATETNSHLMASPASVGSAIADALTPSWLSERSAIKLEFAENPNVIAEVAGAKGSAATAQAISLATLDVPNTIVSGANAGLTLESEAFSVTGDISLQGQTDYYSFTGQANEIWTFEVMSEAIENRLPGTIDSTISIYGSDGTTLVTYFGVDAFNDDELETLDSHIIDLTLPTDGTYYVEVGTFSANDVGSYELFGYNFRSFTAVPEPNSLGVVALFGAAFLRRRRRS